jgi:orotate phosphoribosyltransferase
MPSFDPALELEERLRATTALLDGHFQLSCGLHSLRYVQCARLLQYPAHAAWAGTAHELARALGVRAVFTERVDGLMSLRRGFAVASGERALVAEDVITTGGSAREAATCVEELGAVIAGYACLVDRGGAGGMGAPAYALARMKIEAFSHAECPGCRAGKPVEKPGSRQLLGVTR